MVPPTVPNADFIPPIVPPIIAIIEVATMLEDLHFDFPPPDDPEDEIIPPPIPEPPANLQRIRHEVLTVDAVRDAIVSQSTLRSYVLYNFFFFLLLYDMHSQCLTHLGATVVAEYHEELPDTAHRLIVKSKRNNFTMHLRECFDHPLLLLNLITPTMFISFLTSLRHARNGSYLGRSAYQQRRSALFHFFRLHNRVGFTSDFSNEMSDLYNKVLFRVLTHSTATRNRNRNRIRDAQDGEVVVDARAWANDESKAAMSVQLLCALCGWFLDYQTVDGVFAHCFLLMTWNLACRVNNTSHIKMNDIAWREFDCLTITFAHSKTDQTGEESKYPRHIFANPVDPIVCPVLSLAFYMTACFESVSATDSCLLFPGGQQESRFSRILKNILNEHKAEVNAFGFEVDEIGTHSIRKGASSYLTSLPGGPPAAASSLRGGWTMGNVKDRYFKYQEAGDQYVGRCLALLPMLSVDLATSPPFFDIPPGGDYEEKINGIVTLQFSSFDNVFGFERLLRMCLASLVYHHRWVFGRVNPNHCIVASSHVYRSAATLKVFDDVPHPIVKVSHPWNDDVNKFSGIPPHAALLQELAGIRSNQVQLIDGFVDKVKVALVDCGVTGGQITETHLQRLFDKLRDDLKENLVIGGITNNLQSTESNAEVEREETGRGYMLHLYGGKLHRVPADWRIPRCGCFTLWRQWWIGDSVRQIPPLRHLSIKDIEHLNNIPLSAVELHRRTGARRNTRRRASKLLSDMKFLMRVIWQMVLDSNAAPAIITIGSDDFMFKAVSEKLIVNIRDDQKQWLTVVRELRRRRVPARGGENAVLFQQ